jgi:hypothetical protein
MKFGFPQIIASGVITLLSLSSAQAIPLYYTFEGSASPYNFMDDSNMLGDIGMSAGDTVSLSFMIDRDLQGTFRDASGNAVQGNKDNPPSGMTNYFFQEAFHIELVESSVFDLVQGLYPTMGEDGPWSGSGGGTSLYRDAMLDDAEVSLSGGSDSIGHHQLYIYKDISEWVIGSTVSMDNRTILYGDQQGESSVFHSELTLTAISNANPASNSSIKLVSGVSGGPGVATHSVPEPSTFLLMGIGLLGIGARRYHKSA